MTPSNPLDETRIRYQKWMKRMLEDPTGRDVVGEALGMQVKKVDGPEGEFAVAVLVPSYNGLHPKMQDSSAQMIHYAQRFFPVFTEPVQGSSIIPWLRNDMYAKLKRSGKPYTHVLWIDDDMELQKDYLVRMMERDKPVVGVPYTRRMDSAMLNLTLLELDTCRIQKIVGDETDWSQDGVIVEDGLMRAAEPDRFTICTGTGLMLIRKEVMERVGEFYVQCEYEKKCWNLTDEQTAKARAKRRQCVEETGNAFWFQLLPRIDGWGESGEDSSFCIKSAMCGYPVYIDTTIQPGHVGEYVFGMRDYLHLKNMARAKKQPLNQSKEVMPNEGRAPATRVSDGTGDHRAVKTSDEDLVCRP